RLEQDGAHWRAHTPGGTVRSRQVIVATNGYTDRLVPGLAESIVPLTPIQIATDPLPKDVLDSILPQGHTISDSRRVIMYARREPDGRLVYGGLGRLRGGAFHGFDWLRRDAVRVFPQLAGTAWTHAWGGRIALTGDHLPHIHQPQEGLLVGLGYNGRGVAMSFVMGRTLAEAALGQTTLDLPISRITPFPWRRIKRFGMGAAISYMRLRDSFEFR
ncbi:MAG: FAD-binding oxidoreductase, partial [Pseudomonadota bacterium]